MRRAHGWLWGAWILGCGGGGGPGATTGTGESDSTGGAASGTSEAPTTGDPSSTGVPAPDLPPPPPECVPQGGGPHWVLEGDPLSFQLSCMTGLALPGSDFVVEPLPPGAAYDPATATLSWTPALDQGAAYLLKITATSLGEVGSVKIGVLDRWDDPGNVPVVDPSRYLEEYDLPVFHLTTAPDINADVQTPATLVYRGHTYAAEAKYRGAASLGYPKKSFTLGFPKEDKFEEPELGGGFTGKRKLVLISTFDDNSYVRQRLAYEMWNILDPAHLQIQVYSAVVFLNGEYWGLYTVADHVDGYLMEDHDLSQTGNLYKARNHDANFRLVRANDQPKSTPHDGLTKEEGLPPDGQPGAYDDLDELVTFVATATDAEFLAEIDARIDRRDYEDWWIFVSLIMGDDSAGKNSYHYHDPVADQPWRYLPWDFNDSFGQTWQTARKGFDADPAGYAWANEIFTRFFALPSIDGPLRARYGEALGGVYAADEILARVDAMLAETEPSARRDAGKWDPLYQTYGGWNWRSDFLDYDGEVAYLRQWIEDRWAFVDALY